MKTASNGGRLSVSLLAAYGGLALPLSTIGLPLSIYLAPFYAKDIGIPLALVGTAMLLGRFSDIVTDPLIGLASDRWRTRFGRRRLWIVGGVPALAASVWMLFNPPLAELWSFIVWLTLTYIAFTAIQLPYNAWGAELSSNYETRSKIVSVRQVFSIAGLIASTLVPAWVQSRPGATAADVLHALGWLMLILLPLFGGILVFKVPEPVVHESGGRFEPVRLARQLWRNKPFRILNIVLLCGYVAETFRITITLFFARDIIGLENVGLLYVLYFVAGFLFVPAWAWLGNRIGKHRALGLAFSIVAISTLAMFFLEKGQTTAFTMLFLFKGMCFGSLELLPASMLADTADVDSVMSKARRQGQMFAVTGMVMKFGQALGQFLSLGLLALAGFNASGANSDIALFWLRVAYCVLPPLVLLAQVAALWRYPLTAARHRKFQNFVETRFQGQLHD